MSDGDDLNDPRAHADQLWRQVRNGALWRLTMLAFVTFVFATGAVKRWWDAQVVEERMRAAGLTTQPALGASLRFVAQQARFESALFVAAASIVAVLAFFAFRRYDRLRRDMRMMFGRCMRCGYELDGLTEPRCPECGAAFASSAATDDQ